MKTALIIIDLQEGSFTPRTARHDTAGLVGRLNRLVAEAAVAIAEPSNGSSAPRR